MKIIGIQEAYKRKFERQAAIEELEYHASGHCVHVGKLSPGCYHCFVPDAFSTNFRVGSKCNCNCTYCTDIVGEETFCAENALVKKGELFQKAVKADFSDIIPAISFTGGGEPLMHLEVIAEYMGFYRRIEPDLQARPWYYLYTNGVLADTDTILRLKDMGFNEIRFHLGASNFSSQVYENMSNAVRHLEAVAVETPAWPPHREKLFEMLPIIEDIGVKHLNIGQVMINQNNREGIAKALPDAEIYLCFLIHLNDGGLVYDIIEEVLKRNYSYSVLDCSCFVKSIQRTPGKWVAYETVKGLCRGQESYTKGVEI